MIRTVLSFCSVLFLGTVGLLGVSIYHNLSMAQWNLPGRNPVAMEWALPRIDVVVEYNDYSIAEETVEVAPPPPSAAVIVEEIAVEEEMEEDEHLSPHVAEVEETVHGDDVSGRELVEHYGFPTPDETAIRTIDLKNYVDDIRLEETLASFNRQKSLNQLADTVSTEQSSPKEPPSSSSQEMIFIDYSKKKKTPVPQKKPPKLAVVKKVEPKRPDPVTTPPLLALASKFVKEREASLFERNLRAYSAVDGQELDFQFIPDYDDKEILSSDDGVLRLFADKKLGDGLLRGRIVSPGHIKTVVNLPLAKDSGADFSIPLLDEQVFEEYRQKGGEEHGGFLLIWLSKNVDDVAIDSDYSFRILLDEEFREVSQEDGYSYVLFMNTHPGVSTLSYLLEDGQVAEKPVHIAADEILYDFASLEKATHKTFELYQKNLFSGRGQELDIAESSIRHFSADTSPVKKGLNAYEMKNPPRPEGARNYLKLGHLDGTLYVGHEGQQRLEVPGQDFIENIMDGFGMEELLDSCLIQLNFSRPLVDFQGGFDGGHNSDDFDFIYLNSDGTFEELPSLRTEKAFIRGVYPGVLSGRIEYSDGSWELFKSFCSPGSYLVEQL